jgi:hypothetical protein
MPALVCPVVRPEDVALGVGPRRQLAVSVRLHDVDLASDGPAARGGVICVHEHHRRVCVVGLYAVDRDRSKW